MFNKAKPTNAQPKAQPKTPSKPQPANTTKQIIAVGDDAVEITITTRPVPATAKPKQSGVGKEMPQPKLQTKRTLPKKK